MNTATTIEQGKTLRYEKVASFRGKLTASEINDALQHFVRKLQESGAQKAGPMISATHSVEIVNGEQMLDIEFLVAIDRVIELNSPYKFKDVFQLVNALYTRYVGDPNKIEDAYNELFTYILRHELQQITSVYNVNVNDDKIQYGESPFFDLYISINPNNI
ncbi:hypothetical protein J40TS1_32800 [Paenibacillus montaniterrae]|uniref:Uncharacterized protein n=1 Tax=Paenibacillus montaniterrae TaxID=429341 RepID=A0A919YPG2_9BACL|nr:GyrI-like domain-containing protein [Paenibacillus montaniterrae]GIP17638.1 hypothetical protein J40TS1_32800 [Paenibacillus montaniterrae]